MRVMSRGTRVKSRVIRISGEVQRYQERKWGPEVPGAFVKSGGHRAESRGIRSTGEVQRYLEVGEQEGG